MSEEMKDNQCDWWLASREEWDEVGLESWVEAGRTLSDSLRQQEVTEGFQQASDMIHHEEEGLV